MLALHLTDILLCCHPHLCCLQSLGVGSLCVLLLFALSMLLTRLLAIKQGGFRLWWSHPGGVGGWVLGHTLFVAPYPYEDQNNHAT
jgi:hypothetical protein